jgi:nitronate monooxygenase
MNFGSGSAKAWRDIWGAGQGVGLMDDMPIGRRNGGTPQARVRRCARRLAL